MMRALSIIGIPLLLSTLIVTTGCNKRPRPAEASASTPIIHEVKYSGENLSVIAHWYTGKASNWEAILNANPDIKTPKKLRLGSLISIPGELVTQRSPLTKTAVSKYVQKAAPTPASSPADATAPPAVKTPSEPTPEPKSAEVPLPPATVTTSVEAAAPSPTPFPELPTPSPSEIARDTLIDEILSEKPQ